MSLNNKSSTQIYLIGFFFIYISQFTSSTSFTYLISNQMQTALLYFGMGILVFKWILENEYYFLELLVVFILIIVGCVIYKTGQTNSALVAIVAGVSARKVDMKTLLKFFIIMASISIVIMIILSLSGYLYNFTSFRDGHMRAAFGDIYATGLSGKLTLLTLTAFMATKFKFSYLKVFVIVSLILFNYKYTDSRVDIAILGLILLITILGKPIKNFLNKFSKFSILLGLLPVVLYGVMKILMNQYAKGSSFAYTLDGLLSNRIYWSLQAVYRGYKQFPLFGQVVDQHGAGGLDGYFYATQGLSQYFFLDNAYIAMTVTLGMVFSIVIFAVYYIGNREYVKMHDYNFTITLIIFSVYLFINQYIISLAFSPILIVAFGATMHWLESLEFKNKQTYEDDGNGRY